MEFEKAVQELKEHIKDYAEGMLTKSRGKNQYVCPFCASGTGVNGTGAFTVYENHFYCFSCQKNGDIFDLVKQVEGIDKKQVVQHTAQRYGINIDRKSRDSHKKEEIADYTAFYRECNSHLQETDYHRGISLDTLNRFLVGYDAQWKHPKAPKAPSTPRLIIPTSKTSYFARDTRNAVLMLSAWIIHTKRNTTLTKSVYQGIFSLFSCFVIVKGYYKFLFFCHFTMV